MRPIMSGAIGRTFFSTSHLEEGAEEFHDPTVCHSMRSDSFLPGKSFRPFRSVRSTPVRPLRLNYTSVIEFSANGGRKKSRDGFDFYQCGEAEKDPVD